MAVFPIGGRGGPVHLDRLDCVGCKHRYAVPGDPVGVCQRFPAVFRPSTPAQDGAGKMVLAEGGWCFPPAAFRCGEFARSVSEN